MLRCESGIAGTWGKHDWLWSVAAPGTQRDFCRSQWLLLLMDKYHLVVSKAPVLRRGYSRKLHSTVNGALGGLVILSTFSSVKWE